MRDLITLPEEGPETYTNGSEFDSPKGDHAPGILFVATCLEGPFFDPQQPTMSCTPAVREEAPTGARDQIGIGPFSSPCSLEGLTMEDVTNYLKTPRDEVGPLMLNEKIKIVGMSYE